MSFYVGPFCLSSNNYRIFDSDEKRHSVSFVAGGFAKAISFQSQSHITYQLTTANAEGRCKPFPSQSDSSIVMSRIQEGRFKLAG
jgi:hypothetical protein